MHRPKITKEGSITVSHHGVTAEFYRASGSGFYCDVFFGQSVTGEGFAMSRRQALKEALHNAADNALQKLFSDLEDNIDTIPAPRKPSDDA